MKTLNFSDRLTYLAWRKEWKAEYAEISQSIRDTKRAFKDIQKKVTFGIVDQGKPWQHISAFLNDKPLGYQAGYYTPMNNLVRHRRTANELLATLHLAKEKSCRQRDDEFAQKQAEMS